MPHQDEPNSLVINQRVWFVLFVVNQFHRHIWLFGLSCLLSTNFTVIFDYLLCLVCWQPISPSYLIAWFVLFVINQFRLIITIAFKRGKQHQRRYIRNSVGLLCRFNPLKAVLSDCSHCFKRTEHISAGTLEIVLASYVVWSLESSANRSCHPFQYEESSSPWWMIIIIT